MSMLKDVLDALDRIPVWKRMQQMPAEIEALRARVEQLEARLRSATGDQCPKCRAMSFELIETRPEPEPWGSMGAMETVRRCSACAYERIDKDKSQRG